LIQPNQGNLFGTPKNHTEIAISSHEDVSRFDKVNYSSFVHRDEKIRVQEEPKAYRLSLSPQGNFIDHYHQVSYLCEGSLAT
jgi:hypothetical protein